MQLFKLQTISIELDFYSPLEVLDYTLPITLPITKSLRSAEKNIKLHEISFYSMPSSFQESRGDDALRVDLHSSNFPNCRQLQTQLDKICKIEIELVCKRSMACKKRPMGRKKTRSLSVLTLMDLVVSVP